MIAVSEKKIRRQQSHVMRTVAFIAASSLIIAALAVLFFRTSGISSSGIGGQGTSPGASVLGENTVPDEGPTEEELAQKEAREISNLIDKADLLAAGYDYDKAVDTIKSFSGTLSEHPELTKAIAGYETTNATMVRYADPTTIPQIFFHSLIVDTGRAFDGEYTASGYNLYMVTVYEFERMLDEMYKNGYVLVNIQDVASVQIGEDGSSKYVAGDIMLPEGKKPFVLSQDDVNYYEYMTDSDGDHLADAGGDGFADKIVIGDDGYPTCEYITADGETVTGDYDIVPILEKFIQAHPDFSYRGARAIIGVTGYQGVFGYRTQPDSEAILGPEKYAEEKEQAKAVAECLKAHGWVIASHSYGHPYYGNISSQKLAEDVQKWEDQVQPIVGDTDILLYPFGSDIAGVGKYSGDKYDTLYAAGFRYFCNVDSAKHWVQIRDDYVRMARRDIDGYRMYWNPEKLEDLFDVNSVFDPARPTPVPSI